MTGDHCLIVLGVECAATCPYNLQSFSTWCLLGNGCGLTVLIRVEWEFWTSSNDASGDNCDRQSRFKLDFAEIATSLEKVHMYGYFS